MTDYTADIHMLVDRPVIEQDEETYPSIRFRNVPSTQLGGQFILSVTGDRADRLAVAAALRDAAAMLERWTASWERADSEGNVSVGGLP